MYLEDPESRKKLKEIEETLSFDMLRIKNGFGSTCILFKKDSKNIATVEVHGDQIRWIKCSGKLNAILE